MTTMLAAPTALMLGSAVSAAGVPVAGVNPRFVRAVAPGIGHLAQTDRLDAWRLAPYGAGVRPPVRPALALAAGAARPHPHQPVRQPCSERLRAAGTPATVALIAVARPWLGRRHARVGDPTTWQPTARQGSPDDPLTRDTDPWR